MKKYVYLVVILLGLISCEQKPNETDNTDIRFAVSENSYVAFSKGNIQYQASSPYYNGFAVRLVRNVQ